MTHTFYEPGFGTTMKLLLRRTLVRSDYRSAKFIHASQPLTLLLANIFTGFIFCDHF